ncbi:hypothetical protein ODZ84_22675 [Chryseobacterium fluminis]|uniref:hypothetical protein n=1 Tax=Chryseobacterium fluminis TaxID=2983606 RepID=UPI002253088B|nr:hypothetical protein [Chryseobacterium sp. MMS21-Ot14]UZT97937.1 hypothetical protein ODZ84_22675 [Chryseobacterium sp. MMS21-Ot14]
MNIINVKAIPVVIGKEKSELQHCQGVKILKVIEYMMSISNQSFSSMDLSYIATGDEEYLTITHVKISNFKEYIKFMEALSQSEYGRLIKN